MSLDASFERVVPLVLHRAVVLVGRRSERERVASPHTRSVSEAMDGANAAIEGLRRMCTQEAPVVAP